MTTPLEAILFIIIFIVGIIMGSFLNVCICRIPLGEHAAVTRFHCMRCGCQLKLYDLVPLFSYLFLGGRCRKCKAKISVQYPLIEAGNGILYMIVFIVKGFQPVSILYCLLGSALLALSVIDFRTYKIPVVFPIFILVLGAVSVSLDWQHWQSHVIGAVCVSGFLLVLFLATKGRVIGGGDVKLMAACGLFIGWKLVFLAFLLGCALGCVIHLIRMKVSGAGHVLAMGPYLSAGVIIAVLWGNQCIDWYVSIFS